MPTAKQKRDYVARVVDWEVVRRNDLRRTCIHEFAHERIAERLGASGGVTITKNENGSIEEKFYTGQYTRFTPASKARVRLIGLAGSIAEQVDREPKITAGEIYNSLVDGGIELSETDAHCADGYRFRDVARCLTFVRALWTEINEAAVSEMHLQEHADEKVRP